MDCQCTHTEYEKRESRLHRTPAEKMASRFIGLEERFYVN
jgi:hypothetical protein